MNRLLNPSSAPHGDHEIRLPVARFQRVSLQELPRESELLVRFDRKYLVRIPSLEWVIEQLDAHTRVLTIEGRNAFAYESVYFDTPEHLSHRLAAQSRRQRFKIRTRSYLDTGTCFLEVKTRDGRGNTVKERISHPFDQRETLTDHGREFISGILAQHGHGPEVTSRLDAAVRTHYHRTTLVLADGSRVTIDTGLEWSEPTGALAHLQGYVILESKSAKRVSPMDKSLWWAGYRPTKISKFGTGTALLNPDLPRNKWNRILSGPLSSGCPA